MSFLENCFTNTQLKTGLAFFSLSLYNGKKPTRHRIILTFIFNYLAFIFMFFASLKGAVVL